MKTLIVTIYYNRAQQVSRSVQSLLESAPKDSTIMLVNDGSTDDTLLELKKFEHDSRVVVQNYPNQGFSTSLKMTIDNALKEKDYDFISVVGSGDICSTDKFTKQLNYMNEQTDIVALGTGHAVRSYKTGHIILEENGEYEASIDNLEERVPFTHGTVIYRANAYSKAGGYHSVFKYSQDKDLYMRLIKLGRIVRYPETLYTQFVFEDSASSNPKKKREQIKYQHLIFLNHNNPELYDKAINELETQSIHSIFDDHLFKKKYENAQKRLIYQGEFGLAAKWAEILYTIDGERKQRILKNSLPIIEKRTSLKFLTSRTFYYARKLLR